MLDKAIKWITICCMMCNISTYGQDFSNLWRGHFSFSEVVDVVSSSEKVYAASENAVFSFDLFTNELETVTTIEGLSGQTISALTYSENFEIIIIGYENGLIELFFEGRREVLSIVDILERENIAPDNRRINSFLEFDNSIYIATNYGVSVYNLERLEFGDTYFLGNGGTQIVVNQTAIFNGEIYAACLNNNGVKKASLDDPNLIDFEVWQTLVAGNFDAINSFNNNVFAVNTNRVVYGLGSGIPAIETTLPARPLDAKSSEQFLSYTSENAVYVFNAGFNLVSQLEPSEEFNTRFMASELVGSDIFIGTEDFGLLKNSISSFQEYQSILPNGPIKNAVFRVDANNNKVWATFGIFTENLNPFPLTSEGVSYLDEEVWVNIPFDSLLGARELNKITPSPFNPNQVFISSFKDGILELNNLESTILYDETNSSLQSLVLPGAPDFRGIRVSGANFDNNGVLWSLTSRVESPLSSYDPNTGSWRAFSFSSLIGDPLNGEIGFFDLEVANDGTKWIGAYTNGLVAYNESLNEPIKNLNSEEQNLPFQIVSAIALDNRNQLWVGTPFGIRVLFNTANFFDDPLPTLSSIIILEDGIPRELLDDQSITDIKVDGSNNKWVGTADSGIFYFSPDGQNTIYHFTTANSPIPSNNINDISVDSSNGRVYIATDRGMVSFLAGGSSPESSLEEAYVYPNPVRPEYEILGFNNLNDITKGVKITGLTEDVNIKITDVEGNLVAEAQSRVNLRSSAANYNFAIDGGTAIWNGRNLANNIVASGVYVILINDLDNFETKVLKLLIIR
ncbi:MAG: ABC transporter substrate-binding protein [Bacteroidota bacterium]